MIETKIILRIGKNVVIKSDCNPESSKKLIILSPFKHISLCKAKLKQHL